MLQLGSLAVGGKQANPTTERREIKILQKYFFPNAYLAENSKPPQFWVKQINYRLSIRKDSFSSLSAFNKETQTWKTMWSLTWEILAFPQI